ncbi:MAG TPA: ABA4-like family protein [Amaricoccus sp.]|nr:ABA4-like family protein [Amaricoccus sp.]
MSNEAVFGAVNMLALGGWLALGLSWRLRGWAERIAELVVPLLLAVAYTGLVLAFWSRAPGGFGSLGEVMALFTSPEIALAGWIHYLAFDLLVGAWEVRTARREGLAFLLLLPCLAFTFLFGPAGFLLFNALRAAGATRRRRLEVRS